ncbi:helix-turn-helix domain-containing protein [Halococcoides cellulosivorans]|uniref:ArsR family transcriptional regulator n=1 Tax=Halococcoides cellulosivorans TaxID=1679096 RepID=A0A2R4X1I3_9EURY|nr:helix-turn-helix domain-containing protein [Halococcoides cellulosivorans]AWB27652.1 ArsR family transcriptional regulator [Halococcoides cellulosivorans]
MPDESRDALQSSPTAGDDLSDRPYAIYRCQDCANVVLSMQDCEGGMTCHDEPMERVREPSMEIQPPDLREVLLDAFGLPRAGLDICLCVVGEGPLSPAEVAAELDYDESTIRSYLNELVDLGLLQKSQLNRESGGFVNVYHSVDLDAMREDTLIGFYVWAGEAAALIEEANLTKADYLDADHEAGLETVFWEEFAGDREES